MIFVWRISLLDVRRSSTADRQDSQGSTSALVRIAAGWTRASVSSVQTVAPAAACVSRHISSVPLEPPHGDMAGDDRRGPADDDRARGARVRSLTSVRYP